jgi:transcriptional regulator with XRE-family HTH domain
MLTVTKNKASEFNGAKLRELRAAAKLSQAKLAEKAGIADADVSRYERGLVVPSFDVVCRLADALGVGIQQFRSN